MKMWYLNVKKCLSLLCILLVLAISFLTKTYVLYYDVNSGAEKVNTEYLGIPIHTKLHQTDFSRMVKEEGLIQGKPLWIKDSCIPTIFISNDRSTPYRRSFDGEWFCKLINWYNIQGEQKKKMILWEMERLKNFDEIRVDSNKRMGAFMQTDDSCQKLIDNFK